jgi:hypothetical protein
MPILPLMATDTTLRVNRLCRLCGLLAALAVSASWCASAAIAAENPANKAPTSRIVARSNDALPAPSSETHATTEKRAGNVFCNGIRLQDEIVLVNTRQICGCDPEVIRNGIRVESYAVCDEAGNRKWQPSDLESFLAFNPAVPTVIFVHGNQISPWDAKCEGLAVYRRVILHADDAPIRYVIFSWPSTRISGGLLNDIRVKAARTGPAGVHLAWLIDQMPAETPVSLAGFSFGARIITGGLHVLAGGSLGGSMSLVEHVHPNRQPISAFMMASATHAHWLGDGCYHGLALTQVSRMMLINNCEDPAMKYYDFIEPGFGGPQALGLCGPTCISAENARKVMNRDVSCSVGNVHDLMRYMCAAGNAGLFWEYTAGAANTEVEAKTGG